MVHSNRKVHLPHHGVKKKKVKQASSSSSSVCCRICKRLNLSDKTVCDSCVPQQLAVSNTRSATYLIPPIVSISTPTRINDRVVHKPQQVQQQASSNRQVKVTIQHKKKKKKKKNQLLKKTSPSLSSGSSFGGIQNKPTPSPIANAQMKPTSTGLSTNVVAQPFVPAMDCAVGVAGTNLINVNRTNQISPVINSKVVGEVRRKENITPPAGGLVIRKLKKRNSEEKRKEEEKNQDRIKKKKRKKKCEGKRNDDRLNTINRTNTIVKDTDRVASMVKPTGQKRICVPEVIDLISSDEDIVFIRDKRAPSVLRSRVFKQVVFKESDFLRDAISFPNPTGLKHKNSSTSAGEFVEINDVGRIAPSKLEILAGNSNTTSTSSTKSCLNYAGEDITSSRRVQPKLSSKISSTKENQSNHDRKIATEVKEVKSIEQLKKSTNNSSTNKKETIVNLISAEMPKTDSHLKSTTCGKSTVDNDIKKAQVEVNLLPARRKITKETKGETQVQKRSNFSTSTDNFLNFMADIIPKNLCPNSPDDSVQKLKGMKMNEISVKVENAKETETDKQNRLREVFLDVIDLCDSNSDDEDDLLIDVDSLSEEPSPIVSETVAPNAAIISRNIKSTVVDSSTKDIRVIKVCMICDKTANIRNLEKCVKCLDFYHNRCAKEYGDANRCWSCDMNDELIDDSDLTNDDKEQFCNLFSVLHNKQIEHSDDENVEIEEEEKQHENQNAEVDFIPFGDAKQSTCEDEAMSPRKENIDLLTSSNVGKARGFDTPESKSTEKIDEDGVLVIPKGKNRAVHRLWSFCVEKTSGSIEEEFKRVTRQIEDEMKCEEKRKKYSFGGLSSRDQLQNDIERVTKEYSNLQDYYIMEQKKLQKEKKKHSSVNGEKDVTTDMKKCSSVNSEKEINVTTDQKKHDCTSLDDPPKNLQYAPSPAYAALFNSQDLKRKRLQIEMESNCVAKSCSTLDVKNKESEGNKSECTNVQEDLKRGSLETKVGKPEAFQRIIPNPPIAESTKIATENRAIVAEKQTDKTAASQPDTIVVVEKQAGKPERRRIEHSVISNDINNKSVTQNVNSKTCPNLKRKQGERDLKNHETVESKNGSKVIDVANHSSHWKKQHSNSSMGKFDSNQCKRSRSRSNERFSSGWNYYNANGRVCDEFGRDLPPYVYPHHYTGYQFFEPHIHNGGQNQMYGYQHFQSNPPLPVVHTPPPPYPNWPYY